MTDAVENQTKTYPLKELEQQMLEAQSIAELREKLDRELIEVLQESRDSMRKERDVAADFAVETLRCNNELRAEVDRLTKALAATAKP